MDDKTKEWQMEMILEKLRSKSLQSKSFFELAKAHRMTLLEKRYPLDSVEKNLLQKCLDLLQHSVKVNTLQAMVERLESISRQLGLKFMAGQTSYDWFISSDMFYLEVVLEGNGGVHDVKIHHEGKVEQQSCAELVACLSNRDFIDFTTQLEGLVSIYQLNAEKKVKCKAFSALQSLETDLAVLASLQSFIKEPFNLIHKSPVGALEKRKGGHPMKLTYFVSPYDLLDVENKTCRVLPADSLGSTGLSATVTMESSSAHKLQISTLISISKNLSGKSTPVYAPLTAQNSASLPAVFVLKLSEPLPMCVSLVKKIMAVTDVEVADLSTPQPLVSLITQHSSAGQLNCGVNRGLFVTLPEQQHCYFVTENRNLDGVVISSIPFTHPAHVAQILGYLRQQALFNTLIMSCIRPNSKQDVEKTIIFELMPWTGQHITVSFIHPYDENMTTAELDLTDIANLKCSVNSTVSDGHTLIVAPEYPSKVLQRSFSIPITMRALLKSWELESKRGNGFDGSGLGGPNSGNIGGNSTNNKNQQLPSNEFDPDIKVKMEPGTDYSGISGRYNSDFMNSNPGFHAFSTESPLNPDLSAQLNLIEVNNPSLNTISKNLDNGTKKFRKRKSTDSLPRKSPKSKQGDDFEISVESSSNDSSAIESVVSKELSDVRIATPSSTASVIELSGLSDVESNTNASEKPPPDFEVDETFMEVNDIEDVEEFLKNGAKKVKKNVIEVANASSSDKKSPTQLLTDMENKSLVPPSVSITPISLPKQNMNSMLPGMVLNRRPGIEIFPVVSSPIPHSPVSSSITITAISSKTASEEKSKSEKKKQSKTTDNDKNRVEKKRKRKRDDSPMGPPEKVPTKSDSLSKPVSISIKPADSSTPRPLSPAGTVRKYNCSPTHSPLATGKSSPSSSSCSSKSNKSLTSTHSVSKTSSIASSNSPKNSPSVSSSASPKHNTLSPKQISGSSGSGKPNMSTLKSAVSSPSSSGKSSESKVKSSTKDSSNRDKERKSSNFSLSSGRSSPKIKSSSVKLKQLDLPVDSTILVSEGNISTCGSSDLNSKGQAAARNRKGSLSAVIDKLKSAQSGAGDPGGEGNDGGGGEGGKIVSSTASKDVRSGGSHASKVGDKLAANKTVDSGKNPGEYMVKPSSDGIKITINKTRVKDSKNSSGKSSSSASSGTNSPKAHTGLKPGVASGPASKKPQVVTKTNSSSSSNSGNSSNSSSKNPSSKPLFRSNSSGNLIKPVKSTNSPKSVSSDINRNKQKTSNKSSESSKGIFSSTKTGKSSPTSVRDDGDSERGSKSSKPDPSHPPPIIEGFKQLDTKFQIPKLSARVNNAASDSDNSKKSSNSSSEKQAHFNCNDSTKNLDSKLIEIGLKSEPSVLSKHPVVSLNMLKNVDDKINYSVDSSKSKVNLLKASESSDLEVCLVNSTSSTTCKTLDSTSSSSVSANIGLPKSKSDTNLRLSSLPLNVPSSKDDSLSSLKMDLPISSLSFSDNANASSFKKMIDSNMSKLVRDNLSKLSEAQKLEGTSQSQEAAEILIDFSSSSFPNTNRAADTSKLTSVPERAISSSMRKSNSPSVFPHSPSVQVHIVKSPASVLPSPHSASPCITDDELMDEALVGIGK